MCSTVHIFGQVDSIPVTTPPVLLMNDTTDIDSLEMGNLIGRDTSGVINDTTRIDSNFVTLPDFETSSAGLNTEVNYGGDSTWFEAQEKKYHLYGKAFVDYENMSLKAGYIVFDIDNDIAEAFAIKNALGQQEQEPIFNMGDKEFSYRELKFNFKTKKGIVTDARTIEGEFNVLGERTKFISKESDSTMVDDEIYNTNAIITTCTAEHPHYGIRTRKLKVVPDKLAVIGFSQLEIAGIPVPIFLPFGFFPLVEGQSSGLLLPDNYEYDPNFGLGFREIGYYFPLSDYMDLKLTGDIYTRGTWRINAASNYKKRYGFNGRVNFSFANNKIEDSGTGDVLSQKSFSLRVSHNQDTKAHPYRNIGGTINIQSNNHQSRNYNDANSQLNNRLTSNFNYKHSLPGTPFSLTAGMSHDQNNQTREVNITLPDIRLNMNTIFPLKRKNATGGERWYEKFSLKYDMSMKNLVQATDTTLFTNQSLEDMQTGVSHKASTNASFNVLKYFNVSPNANYEELWFFTKKNIAFDPTTMVENLDTIITPEGELIISGDTLWGEQIESIERGFTPVRLVNTGISMSTQIFGTKTFSKGLLRGIRHIIKPTVSFNYSPDSRSRYMEMVDTDSRDEFNDPDTYNPYQGSPLGSPRLQEKQMAMSFSINNVFEGKYYSKKDSTEKKFKILNTFNISGGYNFAADSLNWQDFSYRGNTRILKLINFTFRGSYTPYVYENGRRTAETLWSDRKKLLEFRNFTAGFSTDFTFDQIRNIFRGKSEESSNTNNNNSSSRRGGSTSANRRNQKATTEESILDLFSGFRISHRLNLQYRKLNDGSKDFDVQTHSISIRGNIDLTKKWKVTLGNISYDLKRKSFVYPSFGLSRDLHCWNMSFNWYPQRGVYSFFIGVKSNTLSFLKYNYGQGNAGSYFR